MDHRVTTIYLERENLKRLVLMTICHKGPPQLLLTELFTELRYHSAIARLHTNLNRIAPIRDGIGTFPFGKVRHMGDVEPEAPCGAIKHGKGIVPEGNTVAA
jgi:hypothetical protein